VILVSFDGFRFDYAEKFGAPNFKSFGKEGVRAEALIPSFPSKTFPNHYTIVTGLYPGHHGLVDNRFYDRQKNVIYEMHEKDKVEDPDYYGGVPLWQLAKQQGVKSASYFWVGSEMSDPARRPDYFFPFDDDQLPENRITQAIAWLKLPEQERPHFITLYFSSPDHEGHETGPSSEATRNAVLKADTLLGKLMTGISEINLPVNVILVSDHGMAELTVAQDTYIFMDEIINIQNPSIKRAVTGTAAHLYIQDSGKRDSVWTVLKALEKNFTVYKKENLPASWHYQNSRVGDLVVNAHPGYYILQRDRQKFFEKATSGKKFGVHGYDPEKEYMMRGIFYAKGPQIKEGLVIPAFQNIHIYPLMAKILGLKPPAVDGQEKVLKKIYRP